MKNLAVGPGALPNITSGERNIAIGPNTLMNVMTESDQIEVAGWPEVTERDAQLIRLIAEHLLAAYGSPLLDSVVNLRATLNNHGKGRLTGWTE